MTSRILRLFRPIRVTQARWRNQFRGAQKTLTAATSELVPASTLAIERTPLEQLLLGAAREASAAADKPRKSVS